MQKYKVVQNAREKLANTDDQCYALFSGGPSNVFCHSHSKLGNQSDNYS